VLAGLRRLISRENRHFWHSLIGAGVTPVLTLGLPTPQPALLVRREKCPRLASAAGFGRGSKLIRRLLPAQRAAILIFDDAGLEEILLLLQVHGFSNARASPSWAQRIPMTIRRNAILSAFH
jgi:hypothetical protein